MNKKGRIINRPHMNNVRFSRLHYSVVMWHHSNLHQTWQDHCIIMNWKVCTRQLSQPRRN